MRAATAEAFVREAYEARAALGVELRQKLVAHASSSKEELTNYLEGFTAQYADTLKDIDERWVEFIGAAKAEAAKQAGLIKAGTEQKIRTTASATTGWINGQRGALRQALNFSNGEMDAYWTTGMGTARETVGINRNAFYEDLDAQNPYSVRDYEYMALAERHNALKEEFSDYTEGLLAGLKDEMNRIRGDVEELR